MTKKRGSKKGQKWPKMGVQKRAKKGSKLLFRAYKKKNRNDTRVTNISLLKKEQTV
jgi:hypothetical protein